MSFSPLLSQLEPSAEITNTASNTSSASRRLSAALATSNFGRKQPRTSISTGAKTIPRTFLPLGGSSSSSSDGQATLRRWLDQADSDEEDEEEEPQQDKHDQGEINFAQFGQHRPTVGGKNVLTLVNAARTPTPTPSVLLPALPSAQDIATTTHDEDSPAPTRPAKRSRTSGRTRQVTPTLEEQQAGRAALEEVERRTTTPINVFASSSSALNASGTGGELPMPVLVESSSQFSAPPGAQPHGSAFRYSINDAALAPSPQASPKRSSSASDYAPSHESLGGHPTPSTPLFGGGQRSSEHERDQLHRSKDDREPPSPLYYRAGRIRMVSGAFEDPPSAVLTDWDLDEEDDLLLSATRGQGRTSSWHDLNMTPSRSLCSSALGYASENGLQTPLSARKRQARALGTSSAQDFLSALSNDEEQTHSVAQRLFAPHSPAQSNNVGPGLYSAPRLPSQHPHTHAQEYTYSGALHSSSPHPTPMSSPLGPRRASPAHAGYGHKRTASGYSTPSSQWAHGALGEARGVFATPYSHGGGGGSSPGREESYERRSESPVGRRF